MSRKSQLKAARDWLVHGGGGHEDGEDGIRAMTVSGEALVEYLASYAEHIADEADVITRIVCRVIEERTR